ncbi:MAG: AraC family transcriptional regulator [Lewinellaceae bacterium]|nr:AraC family transcriptional regulator [Phaeodactylibacter sp.]MCB9036343.1 AraC family transcriptional regulator [Lewinellaceae bacterium]
MIQQINIPPACPLRPYIKAYQWMGTPAVFDDWVEERILPVPVSGLCFQFGRRLPLLVSHGRREKEVLPASYVLPPNTKPFTIHYLGGVQMLGAVFHPAAFFELFGWSQNEFTDRTVPLEDTDGRQELLVLQEKLEEAEVPEKMAKLLDAYFLQKLKGKREGNPAIKQAMGALAREGGAVQFQTLLKESGVGSRHLRRLFNQYLGMPPRDFLRIYRFYRAYWALLGGRYSSLTTLALDAGYYDQAHFIHDFHHFTGLSPQQLLEREFKIQDKVAWKNGGM